MTMATRPAISHAPHGRRRGFALIEALIAVLLLSLTALAYAALQVRGLSANTSAMWRSKATILAYELGDRMRANRAAVTAGNYNALTVPGAPPACGGVASCTPAQMAALDYAQWSTEVGNLLPGGSGVVCRDSTPDDGAAAAPACDGAGATFAVKLFWTEHGTPARLVVTVRP